MSALQGQVGGDHYKGTAIQPVEFWQANRWDGCSCSSMKYLARWRRKAGLEDLKKAIHFVELRQELGDYLPYTAPPQAISMARFISANGITDTLDIAALTWLECYVQAAPNFRADYARTTVMAIEDIISGRAW